MDVRTLARLNGMQPGERLRAGERLVVSRSAPATRDADQNAVERSGHKARGSQHYVVRSGDTLYSIARRHNISVTQLATWNGITAQTRVQVGQQLTVNNRRR
jgi:membrane-bound lytic murein transglycosylase D